MVLDRLKNLVRPDKTYTYVCNDCGEEWETEELRHSAECPECGGPPQPVGG
jgi:rRNA maturation endonuclease Nob1